MPPAELAAIKIVKNKSFCIISKKFLKTTTAIQTTTPLTTTIPSKTTTPIKTSTPIKTTTPVTTTTQIKTTTTVRTTASTATLMPWPLWNYCKDVTDPKQDVVADP